MASQPPGVKKWGLCSRVWMDAKAELHIAQVNKGGYSSRHLHTAKWNTFEVVDGELVVRLWDGPASDDHEEVVLHANRSSLCVEPGVVHQFLALTPVLMYEFYRAADGTMIDPEDIRRFSENGIEEGLADATQHGKKP